MTAKPRTIYEFRQGLDADEFSAEEITRACLTAIQKDGSNAFITVNDRALEAARTADKKIAAGEASVLTGVPIAVKDVLVTKGLRTTAGSKILQNYIPPYTATAVQRLEDHGAIIVGKTNCDEFAMGSSNENSAYGPVKNPRDSARVPGGSSGGSAAAVAAGLVPAALGTDTGGSVRQPASFCGVVGLKPTYGRISRYGLIAMASSLDAVGILATSVPDAAILLNVMAGRDAKDATSSAVRVDDYAKLLERPLRKIKIGLPREYFIGGLAGEVAGALTEIIDRYREIGEFEFVDVSIPHTPHALAVYYLVMPSEVSANLARYDGLRYGRSVENTETLDELYRANRTTGFGGEVRRRIMLGTYALSAGYYDQYYLQASKIRRLLLNDFNAVFNSVDVLLTPTTPTPAFKLGEKFEDPLTMYLSDIFTVSANLAGIPAVSYPAAEVSGLPVGLQLMGPAWSEATLLSLARDLMEF